MHKIFSMSKYAFFLENKILNFKLSVQWYVENPKSYYIASVKVCKNIEIQSLVISKTNFE